MIDPIWVPILGIMIAPVIAIGLPLARAYARRIDRNTEQQRVPAEVMARLERMEQALDTIAIEVERISEGQRFTTKLLSSRGEAPATVQRVTSSQGGPGE